MALPSYGEIMDLVKKGLTLEVQEKVVQLRESALELQAENLTLKARIRELEEAFQLKASVVWEKPYYFRQLDNGSKDGPFCPCCYDKDQKLTRLQSTRPGRWHCLLCKTQVFDSSYQPPSAQIAHGTSHWMGK